MPRNPVAPVRAIKLTSPTERTVPPVSRHRAADECRPSNRIGTASAKARDASSGWPSSLSCSRCVTFRGAQTCATPPGVQADTPKSSSDRQARLRRATQSWLGCREDPAALRPGDLQQRALRRAVLALQPIDCIESDRVVCAGRTARPRKSGSTIPRLRRSRIPPLPGGAFRDGRARGGPHRSRRPVRRRPGATWDPSPRGARRRRSIC